MDVPGDFSPTKNYKEKRDLLMFLTACLSDRAKKKKLHDRKNLTTMILLSLYSLGR